MRENIQKITWDDENKTIKCGDVFTHDFYVTHLDWKYVVERCGYSIRSCRARKKNEISAYGWNGEKYELSDWSKSGAVCGSPRANKGATKKLGMSPKNYAKILKGKQYEHYIKGKEDLIERYGISGGKRPRRDGMAIRQITLHEDKIRELESDGLYHLIPYALWFGKSPKQMKESVGKGAWKKMSKLSKSKTSLICKAIMNNQKDFSAVTPPIELAKMIYGVSSHTLSRFRGVPLGPGLVWSDNQFKKQKRVTKVCPWDMSMRVNIFQDTQNMATRLNLPFNPDWGYRKMCEKHKEYQDIIQLRGCSKEDFWWYGEFPLKTYENGDHTAILLRSEHEVKLQGIDQNHCVGSYAEKCSSGRYLVFDIHEKGKRVSTLGLNWVRDYGIIQYNQHYMKSNKRVTDEIKKFEEVLIKALSAEDTTITRR